MSYDVRLNNAGPVEKFEEGGTHVMGGTTEPELNVTYNYSEVFSLFCWNVKNLDGKRAEDTIPKLEAMDAVLSKFGPYSDYWAPTPGNCGKVVARLLAWARQYPNGIWEVT